MTSKQKLILTLASFIGLVLWLALMLWMLHFHTYWSGMLSGAALCDLPFRIKDWIRIYKGTYLAENRRKNMRHFYCHQQGFLDAQRYNQVTEHEVSVIIEGDGTVSKNRYGLTGIKLDRAQVNLLYSLSLSQIEAYFRDIR